MKLSKELLGEETVYIQLEGDLLGEVNGTEILDAVNESVNSSRHSCAIDLEGVRYINSSGLGVLIAILNKIKESKGKMVLVNPTEQTVRLLEITKLNSVFSLVESKEKALEIIK